MIVLFLNQNLRGDNQSNSTSGIIRHIHSIITATSIGINSVYVIHQLDLLHHRRSRSSTLLLAMMCGRFQNRRVLSSLLEQDIVLMTTYLEILGLRSLNIAVNRVWTKKQVVESIRIIRMISRGMKASVSHDHVLCKLMTLLDVR